MNHNIKLPFLLTIFRHLCSIGVEGAAAYHHTGVADQAVKHRVDNHEEQDPDHGGARHARGGPLWLQMARC